jgi:hypothetical protein
MKNLCGNLSVEILDKDTNVHQTERLTIVSKMKTKICSCFLGRKAATDAKKHYQVRCSLSSQILSP